jgi:hypothetical protein
MLPLQGGSVGDKQLMSSSCTLCNCETTAAFAKLS